MKSLPIFFLLTCTICRATAQPADTIRVKPSDLDLRYLQKGSYSYILFLKKKQDGFAEKPTFVKLHVEEKSYRNKPAIFVTQQWERDTLFHSAGSVFDAKDFSTLRHEAYWKRLGYSMVFDFETKQLSFTAAPEGKEPADSVKAAALNDFQKSFSAYNLNWHADLLVYQLLPYRLNRTFIINFYDPGFSKAKDVLYTVTGRAFLPGRNGEKTECWVLNHEDPDHSYERFWIDIKSREVLKEEDLGSNGYRYKVKMGVGGEL